MFKKLSKNIIFTSIVLSSISSAFAVTIDFNDNADDIYWVPAVSSNGFLATQNIIENLGTPMGTNIAIDGDGPSNGTVHLDSWTNEGSNSIWTLTQIGGGAFSLSAFDFANGYDNGLLPDDNVTSLTLTGLLAGGGFVTQTFNITQDAFQTLNVDSGFTNLASVTFDAFGLHNRAAYDNIVVNEGTNNVPEPATLVLLGIGLASLSTSRKQKAL